MRKFLLLLCLLFPVLASAQYSGSYLSRSGGTITGSLGVTGNVSVQGLISSTNNTQTASPTNSGVAMSAAPDVADLLFFDSTQTANNRTYEVIGFQGCQQFRVKNDAGNAATAWLKGCGGQGSGITSITSDSGSGAWSHTGDMTISGAIVAGSGTIRAYSDAGVAITTPHIVTGNVTLTGGNGTATFTGNAVFSNTNSFVCAAVNTTTNSAVRATNASASSVTFNSGAGTDVIAYQCIGN